MELILSSRLCSPSWPHGIGKASRALYHPHPLLPAEIPAMPPAAFHGAPGRLQFPAAALTRSFGLSRRDWSTKRRALIKSPSPSTCQQEGRPGSSQVGLRHQLLGGKERGAHKGSFCSVAQETGLQVRKHFCADPPFLNSIHEWKGTGPRWGERQLPACLCYKEKASKRPRHMLQKVLGAC